MNDVAYQCRDCGHAFADFYAYDAHRAGVMDHRPPNFGLRCRTDAELIDLGMRLVAGVWMLTKIGGDEAEMVAAGRIWDAEYEGQP